MDGALPSAALCSFGIFVSSETPKYRNGRRPKCISFLTVSGLFPPSNDQLRFPLNHTIVKSPPYNRGTFFLLCIETSLQQTEFTNRANPLIDKTTDFSSKQTGVILNSQTGTMWTCFSLYRLFNLCTDWTSFSNNSCHLCVEVTIRSEIKRQMCLSVSRVRGKDMCQTLFPVSRPSLQLLCPDLTAPRVYFNLSLNDSPEWFCFFSVATFRKSSSILY